VRTTGAGWATAVVLVLAIGCSGGDDDDGSGDVTAACDALEDVANAVLTIQDATTRDEIAEAIEGPLDQFVDAADDSGDDELADLAATAQTNFDTYLTSGDSTKARDANDDANRAFDEAGARCTDLGADNKFPQQP